MKIVMDKPSSSSMNESSVPAESTEANSDASFLDFIMANFFVDGAGSPESGGTQSLREETADEADGQAMEVFDVSMLNQLLTDLQQMASSNGTVTSQQQEDAPLVAVDKEVVSASLTTEASTNMTNAMKALNNSTLISNERVALNAQLDEATTDQLDTQEKTNELVNKPINNNQKSATSGNQVNQLSANEDNDVVRVSEATKVDALGASAFTNADSNAQNFSKNQSNDALLNATLPNTPLPTASLSAHANSMAAAFPRTAATSHLDGQVLTANVSFQMEPLTQLKEKAMSQGVQHIKMNVTPPELGPISARLKMIDGNRMELEILAKSNDVAQVIRSQLHTLRDQFANADIRLDTINVQSQDLLFSQNDSKGSNYEQSVPLDYVANPSGNDIKVKEKNQKVAETLIDAYV